MDGTWDPLAPRARDLAVPAPRDPDGVTGPTRGQAGGPTWRRTSLGLYVRGSVDGDRVEQRIVEQAARGGVVTGWAALRLHRANFFDGTGRAVTVVVADGARARSDHHLAVSREPLPEAEVVVVRCGVRCVSPERALFDEMRRAADLREAVVAADMTFAARLTSIRRMHAFAAAHSRWRRCRGVLEALALCSENSRSPQETRLRLVWVLDAGWPPPECNRPVLDHGGRLLGVPDLLDVASGIVGEYDGAAHRTRSRHRRDVKREDAFRRVGLECVTIVGADLTEPGLVVERLEAARSRSGRLPFTWRLGGRGQSVDDHLDDVIRLQAEHDPQL